MDGCPLGLGLVVEDKPTEFSCILSVESSLKYVDLKFHMQLNSISLSTQDASPQSYLQLQEQTGDMSMIYGVLFLEMRYVIVILCPRGLYGIYCLNPRVKAINSIRPEGAWYNYFKVYYSNASHNWAVYNCNDAFDVINTAECTSYSAS